MAQVLGVDSSTQATKALLVDGDDGTVLAEARAAHPPGTEVDPRHWCDAVDEATHDLLGSAAAVGVGGQQHGMVALDAAGRPVRDALLWNDTRSADAARDLVAEWGGPQRCAELVGSVLVPSFTVTKLRWLRDHEPDAAARVERVLLPHDYVAGHLAAPGTPAFTDRGDASGTGYYSPSAAGGTGAWAPDLLRSALGRDADLPAVVPDGGSAGTTRSGAVLAGGTGDNMAAALGLGLEPGDALLSIGTSGVASMVVVDPVADPSGLVTGFADATGHYLPMSVTLNAAQVLDHQARWLGVDHDGLAELALSAEPGAGGVVLLPYYGGERTPDRPRARGTWTGLSPATTRADLARAAYEALACSLADALDHLTTLLGAEVRRVLVVGGAARSAAVQEILPAVLGRPVELPPQQEYVALGAARQAAWALAGTATPPAWPAPAGSRVLEAAATPQVRERYGKLRERTAGWS
jgi:xylulokinase